MKNLPFLVYLQAENPIHKRAGLICFSCMLEGPTKEKISQLVSHALPIISSMVSDQNTIIQEAAATTLARAAETLPECFLQSQSILQILPNLTQAIMSIPKVNFF